MESIDAKIEKAMVRISGDDKYLKLLNLSEKFNRLYPFTTENIKGYLGQYDFKNQSILTVGASGDHILNLILLGATEIDYFDINPFTEFYVELKLAAVKALEEEEFISYFSGNNYYESEGFFGVQLYHKISPYLSAPIRSFWDSLYLEFTGNEIRISKLFDDDEPSRRVLSDINLYLEKENYDKLKNTLLQNHYKIQFYEQNLNDLPIKLQKKYHAILLSNIGQYLDKMYNYEERLENQISMDEFYLSKFQQLIEQLVFHLMINGTIFIMYMYNYRNGEIIRKHGWYPIYNKVSREKYFPPRQYQIFECNGMRQIQYLETKKDAVLVYKKNR